MSGTTDVEELAVDINNRCATQRNGCLQPALSRAMFASSSWHVDIKMPMKMTSSLAGFNTK